MMEIKHTLTHRHNTYCAAMIVVVAAIAYVYLAGLASLWALYAFGCALLRDDIDTE